MLSPLPQRYSVATLIYAITSHADADTYAHATFLLTPPRLRSLRHYVQVSPRFTLFAALRLFRHRALRYVCLPQFHAATFALRCFDAIAAMLMRCYAIRAAYPSDEIRFFSPMLLRLHAYTDDARRHARRYV